MKNSNARKYKKKNKKLKTGKIYLNLAGLLLAGNIVAAVEQLFQLLLQGDIHINWWGEHLRWEKKTAAQNLTSGPSF